MCSISNSAENPSTALSIPLLAPAFCHIVSSPISVPTHVLKPSEKRKVARNEPKKQKKKAKLAIPAEKFTMPFVSLVRANCCFVMKLWLM